MKKHILAVKTREVLRKTKKLFQQGEMPANISGSNNKSQAISCNRQAFAKLHKEVGDSALFYLKQSDDSKEIPVLISELQVDPLSGQLIHAAFKEVDLKDKITAEIHVEFIGENKIDQAVVVKVKDTVEVEALPTDLPEKFEVDISKLTEVGQSITLADLEYDHDKVSLVIGEEGSTDVIALLQEVKEEVVEETPVEEVAEAGAVGEAASGQPAADGAKEAAKAEPAAKSAA